MMFALIAMSKPNTMFIIFQLCIDNMLRSPPTAQAFKAVWELLVPNPVRRADIQDVAEGHVSQAVFINVDPRVDVFGLR